MEYKGSRWYKCDLHLHTPASKCFEDKSVTPDQWVQACRDAELQCVAVTDHNTGAWIDSIKAAAEGTGLIVFPGVEITCDTSKIHMLILFDKDKTTEDVNDFLIQCGIDRSTFASSEAHSPKTAKEIAEFANAKGGLVIPAHIDDFSGLAYEASNTSFEEMMDLPYISAVQFVRQEYLEKGKRVRGNEELLRAINAPFGEHVVMGEDNILSAYNGVQTAIRKNKRLLTFSDNPESDTSAKHGLAGIGKCYSWLKMDENPTLEGLRQAFMMPERTRNYFESCAAPYKMPKLWIRKICVNGTELIESGQSFVAEFNPQLTTIIGGRGSGKSSILRFLRGAFSREEDLQSSPDIWDEYRKFFQKKDAAGLGVLTDDTVIEVYFVRDGLDYRITYRQSDRTKTIERFDVSSGLYVNAEAEAMLEFFQFEEYSQKQIFSIARKNNALRNRIDSAIDEVAELKSSIEREMQEYKRQMETERSLLLEVQKKAKVTTEIKDLKNKIELLKKSGIAEILTNQQSFITQKRNVEDYIQYLNGVIDPLGQTAHELIALDEFPKDNINEQYREEIGVLISKAQTSIKNIGDILSSQQTYLKHKLENLDKQLASTALYVDAASCGEQFEQKKAALEAMGVTDMQDFEKYNRELKQKEEELKNIVAKEQELTALLAQIEDQKRKVADKRGELSTQRREFVRSQINNDKIQITVRPYFDKDDFVEKFRKITQKSTGYDSGIGEALKEIYADHNVNAYLDTFKSRIREIYDDPEADSLYDGWFTRMIRDLTPSQIDALDMLYPEDQIEMKYKGRDGLFRPLTSASAGQKTTAILTFILSSGEEPLILDQPEDDLDNRLVYDLIVDRLRQIKETRQVIIVTHNANIPVNGDAEYVMSLSSDSRYLAIAAEGTVENQQVKTEICEVMEGGVEAFATRAKKYHLIDAQ